MNLLHHIKDQPFVVATAAAALVHSTWSLGTLFSGPQPVVTAPITEFGTWVSESLELIFWLVPALLIAFALDIGQVATATELRRGHRSTARFVTFGVFSVATYYLQFLYISHHLPVLTLSSGINPAALPFAQGVRDAAVWVIPALLPLSTLLYTFSASKVSDEPPPVKSEPVIVSKPDIPQLPDGISHFNLPDGEVFLNEEGLWTAKSDILGVIGTRYRQSGHAKQALIGKHNALRRRGDS